jgi:hypothetical protein
MRRWRPIKLRRLSVTFGVSEGARARCQWCLSVRCHERGGLRQTGSATPIESPHWRPSTFSKAVGGSLRRIADVARAEHRVYLNASAHNSYAEMFSYLRAPSARILDARVEPEDESLADSKLLEAACTSEAQRPGALAGREPSSHVACGGVWLDGAAARDLGQVACSRVVSVMLDHVAIARAAIGKVWLIWTWSPTSARSTRGGTSWHSC